MARLDVDLLAGTIAAAMTASVAIAARKPGWILDRPGLVLSLLAIGTVMACGALVDTPGRALRLAIDPSTEPLLPAGDPSRRLYDSAVLDFGDDEVYVIALRCPAVFTPECLRTVEAVSGAISRLDGVQSLGSLLDVTSYRYDPEEDWVEVRPFIDDIPLDPDRLDELRERALADPVYRRTLVSDDARTTAINVRFRKMSNAELIERDLDGQIQSILAEHAVDGQQFHVSGRPHFKTHVYRGMRADLLRLIPIGIVVMAIVLWAFTGSVRGVVLPIATALTAIVWTFAAMVVASKPLNLLTVLLAPMLLAIGSVYVVHFLVRFEEDARQTADVRGAVQASMQQMVAPVLIAGLTTLIGFAALLLTDVPAVFELGVLSMLGIGSVTVLVLTGVPAVLLLLPRPALASSSSTTVRARTGRAVEAVLDRMLVALANLVHRHSAAILWVAGAALILSVAALPRIVVDTDYLSYFETSDPVRRDFEAIDRLLAGTVPLYVVVDAPEEGAFRDPELLRAMERLQTRIDALPQVSRTLSFIDSLRTLNRAFEGGDPEFERIPDSRAGVAELLFMLPKAEISRFVTIDHGRANIVVRTGALGSSAVAGLVRDIEFVLAETELPQGASAQVTGNAILLSHSADVIARSQPLCVALAALAIFVLIAVGLRSPRLGAVAMIPNLVPVLVFFGLLGLGAAPLSLPTSLIGCIALGIAIDDTVHFLFRYRSERRSVDPRRAALRCGQRVGRPIAITSVMLVLGFLVVSQSEFATLQEFGVLTAVTMAVCLFADLILLPALLTRLEI